MTKPKTITAIASIEYSGPSEFHDEWEKLVHRSASADVTPQAWNALNRFIFDKDWFPAGDDPKWGELAYGQAAITIPGKAYDEFNKAILNALRDKYIYVSKKIDPAVRPLDEKCRAVANALNLVSHQRNNRTIAEKIYRFPELATVEAKLATATESAVWQALNYSHNTTENDSFDGLLQTSINRQLMDEQRYVTGRISSSREKRNFARPRSEEELQTLTTPQNLERTILIRDLLQQLEKALEELPDKTIFERGKSAIQMRLMDPSITNSEIAKRISRSEALISGSLKAVTEYLVENHPRLMEDIATIATRHQTKSYLFKALDKYHTRGGSGSTHTR